MLNACASTRPRIQGNWVRRHGPFVVAWETVNARLARQLSHGRMLASTEHFTVFDADGDTVVLHRLSPDELDNDVGELLGSELFADGHLPPSAESFERLFSGVVTSVAADPDDAWYRFYRNTLRRMTASRDTGRPSVGGPVGPVSVFAAVYDRARSLVRGASVLDTGSCFGFFPLLITARRPGVSVTGSDRSSGTVALANRMADRLGSSVRFVEADVTRPLGSGRADTVTALHLLEHLPEHHTRRALANLCQAARQRVVVAVPLERRPDPLYGHRRVFDAAGLASLGSAMGWRVDVQEHQGGWLVLDR